MKRLFITTNLEKAILMYNRGGYEKEKKRIETDFKSLPKEYEYGHDFKIMVIDDSFEKWEDYKILIETDYILYHTSSEKDKIEIINKGFRVNHIQKSSHILGELHDKVYQVIFSDVNDKHNSIFNILGFTDKQIEQKETLESKLNFLHHCLIPAGLNSSDLNVEWNAKTEFEALELVKTEGPFGDNYLKSLRTLRDKLLLS